jgi:hypothetical protein
MYVSAIKVGIVLVMIFATTVTTIPTLQLAAEAATLEKAEQRSAAAPAVVSGDNVYVAWWTNKTANNNEEVMFRASTDSGATFGDKINLSNTTGADSWKVEIAGEGDNVVVSWWETNQTSDTPVARISSDAGQTFGPMLMLATNGTIGETVEGTEEVE